MTRPPAITRTLLALALSCALATARVSAAVDPGTPDVAVDKGLEALVHLQQADGSFDNGNTASTALAGIALLAGGHTPTRGAYHESSAKAVRAILAAREQMTGYLGGPGGNMYAHGFATLFLAECYGMAPDLPVRRALESAIDLILYSQNKEGGWRYNPMPADADISVTICQVMALRAAYNAGVGGHQVVDALDRAVAYVRRCATGNGSFSYQASDNGMGGWGTNGPEGVPRTAAGCMCLISAGITDTADVNLGPALLFLRRNVGAHLHNPTNYFWYGQYYSAQALFHSPDPGDWDAYWQQAVPVILARQDDSGQWTQGEGPGPAYSTAMALIILQIPNNYLPIFER
jgi:hypothetical protein